MEEQQVERKVLAAYCGSFAAGRGEADSGVSKLAHRAGEGSTLTSEELILGEVNVGERRSLRCGVLKTRGADFLCSS